jgi:hypothetical protein
MTRLADLADVTGCEQGVPIGHHGRRLGRVEVSTHHTEAPDVRRTVEGDDLPHAREMVTLLPHLVDLDIVR